MKYAEKLKDPRWQKKRLKILERDEFTCTQCGDKKRTLHVHHLFYLKDQNPWEYDDKSLLTICDRCHDDEHNEKKETDEYLLSAIRLNFLNGSVADFADAFANINICFSPDVTSSAVNWLFRNKELMEALVNLYFLFLKNNTK